MQRKKEGLMMKDEKKYYSNSKARDMWDLLGFDTLCEISDNVVFESPELAGLLERAKNAFAEYKQAMEEADKLIGFTPYKEEKELSYIKSHIRSYLNSNLPFYATSVRTVTEEMIDEILERWKKGRENVDSICDDMLQEMVDTYPIQDNELGPEKE